MKLNLDLTYKLNPNVLCIDSEEKTLLTFVSDKDDIFEIDQMAKDALKLVIKGLPLKEVFASCSSAFAGDASDFEASFNAFFENLVNFEILLPAAE